MIDGYTVPEAASVLGVPEGRVWELLARGVISGTPEGDSMRVHLKARTEPMVAASQPAPKSNGNGGSNGGSEASAFRELLTEFRNLTERYGQALLALGEARGEVAGLRSRIELLESRLDLRLPELSPLPPAAWTASEPLSAPPAVATPTAPAAEEPAAPPRPRQARARKAKPAPPAVRTPSPRQSAVEGIAAALARAEDPSVAELPQPSKSPGTPPPVSEAASSGEPEEIAAAAAPTYSTEVVEPDWFADGDFAWLDAAEHAAPEPPVEAPAAATEAEAAEVVDLVEAPATAPDAEAAEAVDLVEAEETLTEAEAEVVAEELAVAELESAPGGYAEPIAPMVDEAHSPAPLTLTEEELATLAADEGWGASEVEAIRSLIGNEPVPSTIELPGSAELDAAMAALDATPATPHEEQWSKAWPGAEPIRIPVEPNSPVVLRAPAAEPATRPAPRPTSTEPAWLRRRRGPAATAFRTLRRLFPG